MKTVCNHGQRHVLIVSLMLVGCILFSFTACDHTGTDLPSGEQSPQKLPPVTRLSCPPCAAFHDLNTQIRDGRIGKSESAEKFRVIMGELRDFAKEAGMTAQEGSACAFPLDGYTPAAIGGKNGSGYLENGYDYFDGNAHRGHPAHDLFIRDRNQDSLDDATGKPVTVSAMDAGLVVSVETAWEKGSRLRGGRYIWIYHPGHSRLTYYAHNERILVKIGDWIKPGDPIATVGRTGYNAARKRSPTHLHMMHLKMEDGLPRPENRFSELSACRVD